MLYLQIVGRTDHTQTQSTQKTSNKKLFPVNRVRQQIQFHATVIPQSKCTTKQSKNSVEEAGIEPKSNFQYKFFFT